MSDHEHGSAKTSEDRSEKAHMPPPPKKAGVRGGKPWGGKRGDAGEFTGQGSSGLQKK